MRSFSFVAIDLWKSAGRLDGVGYCGASSKATSFVLLKPEESISDRIAIVCFVLAMTSDRHFGSYHKDKYSIVVPLHACRTHFSHLIRYVCESRLQ